MDRTRNAHTQLIEQHLPLVRHIVFEVSARFPSHVDRDELAQAGVLGLVQAAHRYDAAQGVPFWNFAGQRIRGAILDAARSSDWAPRSLRRSVRQVDVASAELTGELGRMPTTGETAAALGMTLEELAGLRGQLARSVVLSLDVAVAEIDGEDVVLADIVVDGSDAPDDLEQREMAAYLRDSVELLPERHRIVIEGYFFGGRTSEELAHELGVSVSRISQLRSDAYDMLRAGITAQYVDADGGQAEEAGSSRTRRRRADYASAIGTHRTWKARLAS
ncbi:MAG: sigma-70 family RNA polymerase sigma factor [Acidimicrobiia bacterium]